jgi:hypothetical protein
MVTLLKQLVLVIHQEQRDAKTRRDERMATEI